MRNKVLTILVLFTLLLVACGGGSEATEPETITETVQVEVTRTVTETETVVETVTETETVIETVEVLALPAVDPLAVSGDVVSAGSSTVFPLAEAVAEQFRNEGYSGNITIDSIGSGAGFERF